MARTNKNQSGNLGYAKLDGELASALAEASNDTWYLALNIDNLAEADICAYDAYSDADEMSDVWDLLTLY